MDKILCAIRFPDVAIFVTMGVFFSFWGRFRFYFGFFKRGLFLLQFSLEAGIFGRLASLGFLRFSGAPFRIFGAFCHS